MLKLPRGPRKYDEIEVELDRIAPGGWGVGYIDAEIGPQSERRRYKVMVRKTPPNTHVLARIEQSRKGVLTCDVVEILREAPSLISPRCQHFGSRKLTNKGCGGCTMQNLSYEDQLIAKRDMVQRMFVARDLPVEQIQPVLGMQDPWFFRNKMEFSIGDYDEKGFSIGLHPTGFKHDVIDLQACYVLSEEAMAILPVVRQWALKHELAPYKPRENTGILRTLTIREGKHTGQRLVALTTAPLGDAPWAASAKEDLVQALRALDVAIDSIYWIEHMAKRGTPTSFVDHLLWGAPMLREVLTMPGGHELAFDIHPRAFFQPNSSQAQVLYTEVLKRTGLLDGAAGHVLDLYCGTGTIGMCMAPYASKVTGIELNPQAVENARENAVLNGMKNISFLCGDVGKVLSKGELEVDEIDLVVVDPPRAGLFPQAVEQIAAISPKKLIYVSCNPESLARDTLRLKTQQYVLREIQPVDMFPHTHHIENIAVFEHVPS